MSVVKNIYFRKIIRPLRTTFATSLGQKDVMKSVIVKVRLRDGSEGIGECPTSFVLKNETINAIENIIREVTLQLKGYPIESYSEKIEKLRKQFPQNHMTISGLEVALFRAYLEHKGTGEHESFGGKLDLLETDITVPYTTDVNALVKWIGYICKNGFTVYKIKVSGNMADDKRLVAEVCHRLRDRMSTFTIRLDGNQGFTEKTCLRFLDFLTVNNYPVELFEQPLPKDDYKGLKEISKCSPVSIILDETIFNEADLKRAVEDHLCHGINIKIAKSGISESLKLYNIAKKHGLKLMMGCMTETMVGLSAGINFAAGKGGFDYIDLDGIHFLHHRNVYGSIEMSGSRYILSSQ